MTKSNSLRVLTSFLFHGYNISVLDGFDIKLFEAYMWRVRRVSDCIDLGQ